MSATTLPHRCRNKEQPSPIPTQHFTIPGHMCVPRSICHTLHPGFWLLPFPFGCCAYVRLFVIPWTMARQAPLSMQILQARILEWVAMPFSRVSSQPRDWTQVSLIAGGFFTIWATREALSLCRQSTYWTLGDHHQKFHPWGHLSFPYPTQPPKDLAPV